MVRVGRVLDKFIAYLGYLGAAVGVASIIGMTLMVTLNVFLRFFFNKPQIFVEEFSAYLFIAVMYLGLAHTARVGAHINVELVVRLLPRRVRDGLEVLTSIAALALMIIFFRYAWSLFENSLRVGKRSDFVLQTPLWIPQSFIVLGLVLFCLAIAARIVQRLIDFQKGAKEERGEGELKKPSEL